MGKVPARATRWWPTLRQARLWRPVERGDPSAEFNGETQRSQQLTPALTLPHVHYGLSVLLMEMFCTLSVPSICRQVYHR
jgi:hypothetical protein